MINDNKNKVRCPFCSGSGKVEEGILLDKPRRREMARRLRKLGYSIPVIMRACGYKSPRSVSLALNRKD